MIYHGTKRILVAGGAGFLGSHLCEKLLDLGNEVICLDNYLTGRKSNVEKLIGHPNFDTVRHDIINPIDIPVDEIYNLACPASPIHYQNDPVHTLKTSVIGNLNLLDLAVRLKCKIFFASTSEVYGDPTVTPQPEEYWGNVNPIGVRSCYDEGKRCGETLFFDYNRRYGVNTKVARIFNTYGPKMLPQDGRVISNFIIQALRDEPITIYGDGTQTRSFCFVDDLIDGFVRLMESNSSVTSPINLGNPNEKSIDEIATIIIDMTGSKSKKVFKPLPQDDPKQRCPNIEKAKSELGWEPNVDLQQGLEKTIDYFRQII